MYNNGKQISGSLRWLEQRLEGAGVKDYQGAQGSLWE